MSHDRRIYLLDPQQIPPETIAVTFAKTSRSPQSFDQIASELSESSSAEFNEKWVVGYGHSSVAEHAVLHIAVENISRLAVENLESNRLASYTEKSTRYQTWESDAFYIPAELDGNPKKQVFINTCRALFTCYQDLLPLVISRLEKTLPIEEGESTSARQRRLRSQAVDNCRFLLPAAALANVGVTINARALEHAIGKMLTSPLSEVRVIGEEIRKTATESTPTLLKYANEIPYLREVRQCFSSLDLPTDTVKYEWCRLVDYQPDAVDRLLAAAIYREQHMEYPAAMQLVRSMGKTELTQLVRQLLECENRHTIPARELENTNFTFDLLLDQGAYFEVKRHRMMTQIPQHLTAGLGYATPRLFADAGVVQTFQKVMENTREAYFDLAGVNPHIAAYLVPNGFNRRVLLTLNLRSAIHFIKLRSAPNAHFSVRRVAQRMAEEISRVLPDLQYFLGRNPDETSTSIEDEFFSSTD